MKSRRDAQRVGCRHNRQSRDESSPRASPRIRRPRPRPRRSATPPTIESNRIESNRSRSPILKQDGRRWTDGDLASTIVVAHRIASRRRVVPRRQYPRWMRHPRRVMPRIRRGPSSSSIDRIDRIAHQSRQHARAKRAPPRVARARIDESRLANRTFEIFSHADADATFREILLTRARAIMR